MIRAILLFASLLILGSCNAPGPDFSGLPATRVTVETSIFDIRVRDRMAQAIRVNAQYAPRLGPIGTRAAYAMQIVTGCTVTKLTGDAAVLLGRLHCAEDAPEAAPQGFPRGQLDCYGVDGYQSTTTGELVVAYDCDWRPAP